MSKENPMIRAIEERRKRETDIAEAFEKWFEVFAPSINPLMTKEDVRRVFQDGFDLGSGYNMDKMMKSLVDFTRDREGGGRR